MTTQTLNKQRSGDTLQKKDRKRRVYQPAVDIRETHEGVTLRCDMPGVASENVNLTVEQDTLTIKGQAEPEMEGAVAYRELYNGDYHREFTLHDNLDCDAITADMRDGVLTVHIPKAEKAKPRHIEIASV